MEFTGKLFKTEGKGAWTFVMVPSELAPPVTSGWGMTPVKACVDGHEWNTTVWRDKENRCYLPVPKKIRQGKEAGAMVEVRVQLDMPRVR
jgi:hypothetical protein